MRRLPCDHLAGRLREICEGSTDQGHPIDMLPDKRLAYLRQIFPDEDVDTLVRHIQDQQAGNPRRGLGDIVAAGIKIATAGLVKPCIPCNKRREMLNEINVRKLIPFLSPKPVTLDTPRNLIMHVWPTRKGAWKWNIDQLIQRKEVFTGKVVLGVATGPNTLDVQAVVDHAAPLYPDVFEVSNNPRIREGATFLKLLERVQSKREGITFYCHSKGARHGDSFGQEGSTLQAWTEAMYSACLDDVPSIVEQLKDFSMTGPFRRFGNFKTPGNHRWHYSGAFYWFRNSDVFERNWQKMDLFFFAVESWPGLMFRPEEVACCFHDNCGDLYQRTYWDQHFPGVVT